MNPVQIVVPVVGIIVAIFLAILFGDVAASKLIIKPEKRKEEERVSRTLVGLREMVKVTLPRLNQHNKTTTDQGKPHAHLLPILYPTGIFENAFFTGDSISVRNETIRATTNYLLKAKELDVLFESLHKEHLSKEFGGRMSPDKALTVQFVYDQIVGEMPGLIGELEKRIDAEWEDKNQSANGPIIRFLKRWKKA